MRHSGICLAASVFLLALHPRPAVSQTIFTYTGADQSYVVPSGDTFLFVQLWGAGGGSTFAIGGGGAYISGYLAVTPGETLSMDVGAGGLTNNSFGYGAGGPGFTGNGGGLTAIKRGSTVLALAGAGGGGGGSTVGGAGGVTNGSAGGSGFPIGGGGGTQTAGGMALTGSGATSGSMFQGGAGDIVGGGSGGGGSGYFGGGGGHAGGGGGGGSSFITLLIDPVGFDGNGAQSGGANAPLYIPLVGQGGPFSSLVHGGEIAVTPLTSVPEPSAWFAAALCGLTILLLGRRVHRA